MEWKWKKKKKKLHDAHHIEYSHVFEAADIVHVYIVFYVYLCAYVWTKWAQAMAIPKPYGGNCYAKKKFTKWIENKKHTREHKEHARYEKPFESSRKRIDMLQLGSIHAETESETQI